MNNPFDFEARVPEIDEEANTHEGGSQVVQALRRMIVVQRSDGFQFDENRIFNQQIDRIFSYNNGVIYDLDRVLL